MFSFKKKEEIKKEDLPQDPKSKMKRLFKEWILPYGLEALAILLVIKFVCFFTYVPTGSMVPTIAEKSWLFALHTYNVEKNIERGDIMVFNSEETNTILIKRVIGLPGETVEIIDGVVYIDGEMLKEDYVVNRSYENMVFQVPEGEYLFLGDNRRNSADARGWNDPYIPAEDITGRAIFTILPFSNFGKLK